jgi:hypothetical protein
MNLARHLRRGLAAACLLLALGALAAQQTVLVSAATVTGATTMVTLSGGGTKTFQASGTTTAGAGSVTVGVQCSLDGVNWDTLGTITLTLSTTTASNSFSSNDRCVNHRANVTAISGTGASVTVRVGM